MTEQSILSNRQLLIGVILALAVGTALTFLVILPAETGEDPTGFGEASGLTQLSASGEAGSATVVNIDANALYVSIDPATSEVPLDEFGRPAPSLDGENIRTHEGAFKIETIEISIPGDGQVEYKALMNEGEVLLYSWSADGDLYYDFHAHNSEANADFWTRYAEGEGRADSGSIVAPYSGQHGWYWLNLMEGNTTVTLTVAGYYDEVIEIDLEGGY